MRTAHLISAFFVAATLGSGGLASAQTQTAEAPLRQSFEIGGNVEGFFGATAEGGGGFTEANVRVTAPLKGRFSIEGFVAIPRQEGNSFFGLYGFQIRQRIVRASHGRTDVFATYGGVGGYEHERGYQYEVTYGGRTEVIRGPSETHVYPALFPMIGAGVEQRITDHVAVRLDAQGMVWPYPLLGVVRLSAGVSIPLGHVSR